MRREIIVVVFSFLFFLTAGCEKEPKRMDDYLVDFATLLKEGSTYRFRLDNNRILIPQEVTDYSGNNGQRVILNYVPLRGDSIRIRSISDIFTGGIQTDGFPERYSNDPVKILSVWVGGGYLNMILEMEYHSVAHRVALFSDASSPTVDLWFSHSRENDPRGYPQKLYASFSLHSLRTSANSAVIPFRLFINTHTGIREFRLELP